MALDHYVSQVHLKRFYSPALDDLMYAMRKSDLKRFTPRSQDVCRLDEGNTNEFLTEPRAIEEFLKPVENRYNAAVSALDAGKLDNAFVYAIAGFVAYILTCSPAAMRINSEPLKQHVENVAKRLEAAGSILTPPASLGGKDLTEMLKAGELKTHIDPKFPQAVGIANILERVAHLGNSHWEILINEFNDSPFFTSDFPVGNEISRDWRVMNRVAPLAPHIAVRIQADFNLDRKNATFEFPRFTHKRRILKREEAVGINRLLVQSAEDTIFFRDDLHWLGRFIEKNRHFRVGMDMVKNPAANELPRMRQNVVPFERKVA